MIFRSKNITSAFHYIGTMLGINSTGIIANTDIENVKYYLLPLIVGILFASSVLCKVKELSENSKMIHIIVHILEFILFIVSIVLIIGRGYTAPLYAGF